MRGAHCLKVWTKKQQVVALSSAESELYAAVKSENIMEILLLVGVCFFRVRTKAALVAENFRLSWVDLETHFFSTFLEFVHHFLKLFLGGCEQKHVVGEPQVCEAVVVVVG